MRKRARYSPIGTRAQILYNLLKEVELSLSVDAVCKVNLRYPTMSRHLRRDKFERLAEISMFACLYCDEDLVYIRALSVQT
jgi:DNA-binding transcriptional ArsR family regulator